jgi:hypothetical protein
MDEATQAQRLGAAVTIYRILFYLGFAIYLPFALVAALICALNDFRIYGDQIFRGEG